MIWGIAYPVVLLFVYLLKKENEVIRLLKELDKLISLTRDLEATHLNEMEGRDIETKNYLKGRADAEGFLARRLEDIVSESKKNNTFNKGE